MLKRKVYEHLAGWRKREHKPLLLYGQRQVGKTFIVDRFAKDSYRDYIYIDFSADRDMKKLFEEVNLDVDALVAGIRIYRGIGDLEEGGTLFFFDEVQECPSARAAMKQFALDGRYDVIASGSMLGVSDLFCGKDGVPPLVPLGYEEPYILRSLDFEEFLWANGISEDVISGVKESIRAFKPIDGPVLDVFSRLFRTYQIVGGMPAAVQAYVDDKGTFARSTVVLEGILSQCRNDINRYNIGGNIVKTAECFDSIAPQLAQSNKRFMYSRVETGDQSSGKCRDAARKYRENLVWIKAAGYGNFCGSLRQIALPLMSSEDRDVFKVYMSDTGMLTCLYGAPAIKALYLGDSTYNFGALVENSVCECLVKCGLRPYYYRNSNGEGRMEIDFVVEMTDGCAAIEVKSGKKRDSPSLDKVHLRFKVWKRIKLEDSNIFRSGDGIEHYPLFAAAFLNVMDNIPEYLK